MVGQRQHAVGEIAAHRLPNVVLHSLEVEDVVHYLEGEAQAAPVAAHGLDGLHRRAAEGRARLGGNHKERGRLSVDAGHVVFASAIGIVGLSHLAELPARQVHDRLREAAYDPDVARLAHESGG